VDALAACAGFIIAAGVDWSAKRLGWIVTAP
jgi:hypothetical protein